ncbi:putative protein kinase RLK-Pelle-RLCK-VIIa-1 family [Rosa chinensis]|uniref:Protein kinase domain-containing protein n=1 Tax=Rosa chinensis TaxID=74649 RepID=A0A2P6P9D9_ROSCH|nr:putative protein kinase RLK-Pelle-RLCK-VIIa-1 family [Rosa chinensis]
MEKEGSNYRLLVYEYMPNRSLEDYLFNRALNPLPWITRLQIMLGAAQGLAYLHEGLEVQLHRLVETVTSVTVHYLDVFCDISDFKSSNVLLDEDFKPKLSDFGLAREGPKGDRTHVSTAYVETGHLSIHSDLWSFGVVLYEILTGRRVLERHRPTAEQKLLYWVRQYPADSKKFSMIIDPLQRDQYSINAARKIAKLADSCLNKNAKDRPTMNQVVEILKQAIQDSQKGTNSVNNNFGASGSKLGRKNPKLR